MPLSWRINGRPGTAINQRRGWTKALYYTVILIIGCVVEAMTYYEDLISDSTLHRLEMGEQNVTLKRLEHLSDRLHCRLRSYSEKSNEQRQGINRLPF